MGGIRFMPTLPANLIDKTELEERVRELKNLFSDDVADIEYRFGEDSDGDSSIYFKVLLTAKGMSAERRRYLAREFPVELVWKVRSEDVGLHSYFDFVTS
jgi:hypothetical protein